MSPFVGFSLPENGPKIAIITRSSFILFFLFQYSFRTIKPVKIVRATEMERQESEENPASVTLRGAEMFRLSADFLSQKRETKNRLCDRRKRRTASDDYGDDEDEDDDGNDDDGNDDDKYDGTSKL